MGLEEAEVPGCQTFRKSSKRRDRCGFTLYQCEVQKKRGKKHLTFANELPTEG